VSEEPSLLVETAFGLAELDLATGELLALEASDPLPREDPGGLGLPLVLAVSRVGSRVVAALDRRPPLAVSDDTGITWREAGGGLPRLTSVAIAPEQPDLIAAASATRVFVSADGGRFWRSLPTELEDVVAVGWAGR
jgi:hypothetical protein